ncbi:MAG: ABC transporter substrate-binding protein [Promethearchaeota archaeon]
MVEAEISPKKKKKFFKVLNKRQKIAVGTTSIIALAAIVSGIYFFLQLPKKNSLVVGINGGLYGIESIDPFKAFFQERMVVDQLAECLFVYDPSGDDFQISPNLAVNYSWNGNYTELTCSLRRGVKFHDGTEFNATAVQWNFDRICFLVNNTQYFQYFNYLHCFPNGRRILNKTQVVDDYTIKFVLNAPYISFRALLTHYSTSILSPTSTPHNNFTDITGNLIGTGPFILDSFEPGVKAILSPNLNYWGAKPKIDKLIFSVFSNRKAQWDAMLAGDISMLDPFWTFGYQFNYSLDLLKNDPHITVREEGTWAHLSYIAMNNKLINIPMRKAISYAINYSYIFEKAILYNTSIRCRSPIPVGLLYSNTTGINLPYYNITIARRTLKEAGWAGTANLTANDDISPGNEWEQLVTEGTPLATYNLTHYIVDQRKNIQSILLQDNLKQIGVEIDQAGYVPYKHIMLTGCAADFNDPANTINLFYSNNSLFCNDCQFNDNLTQQWMDQAIKDPNPNSRRQLYNKIQKRIIEELFPCILTYTYKNFGIYIRNLRGFNIDPFKRIKFNEIYFD